MRKLLTLSIAIIMITLMLPFAPSPSTVAQNDDPILIPRYAVGGAIISRPSGTGGLLDFSARMTPDNRYVVGISYNAGEELFVWDISSLGDTTDIITPAAITVDLSAYAPSRPVGFVSFSIQSSQYVIVRMGVHLVQIDIQAKIVTQSIQFANLDPNNNVVRYSGPIIQGDTVALIDNLDQQVTIWDTRTNAQSERTFEEEIDRIRPFRGGWLVSTDTQNNTNVHYFCALMLENCTREVAPGYMSVEHNGVLVFGQLNSYNSDDTIGTTYYTYDAENGLQPTDSIFPNLPAGSVPTSISPDGQYMRVLTPTGESSGGNAPSRYSYIWEIDGEQPISPYGSSGAAGWFGDHFFVDSVRLFTADSPAPLDWLRQPFQLYHTHEGSIFRQVSEDGTRVLFINSGRGMILPIEYQRVDDLLQVDEVAFSMERGDLEYIRLSVDGQRILAIDGDQLMGWNLASDQTDSLDISPYLGEESVIEMLVRSDDAFLQIDNVLLRINLADFSILDEISVDDTLTDFPVWAFLHQDKPSIAQNGETVAALFDNTTVLWMNGEYHQIYNRGGVRIYPRSDGWAILDVVIVENDYQEHMTFCNMTLTDCDTHDIDDTFATFYGENGIVEGNANLFLIGDSIQASYWDIGESITPTDPFIALPENHVPADFHNGYAIVSTPFIDYDTSHKYQIWSVADGTTDPRFAFEGRWRWWGDYVLYTDARLLTIVHYPDGRYTRWRVDSERFTIQLSEDGSRLLIIGENTVEVVTLIE